MTGYTNIDNRLLGIWNKHQLSATARNCYVTLAILADSDGIIDLPSRELEQHTGATRKTIVTATEALVAAGLIAYTKPRGTQPGIYHILPVDDHPKTETPASTIANTHLAAVDYTALDDFQPCGFTYEIPDDLDEATDPMRIT